MIDIIAATKAPLAAYARRELAGLLAGVSPRTARTIRLRRAPSQATAIAIAHGARTTVISGKTPLDILHGAYRFLETLGFLFTVRGPVHPALPVRWPKPFTLAESPAIPDRGIRQHINFPTDISGYALPDAMEYIRNLARMKFSAITFHLYDEMGWLPDAMALRTGGKEPTSLYYSTRFPLCRQPVARERSANRATFFIPEVEARAHTPGQADGLNHWLRRVMQTAKECGLHVTTSVEVTAPFVDAYLEKAGRPASRDAYIRITAHVACSALKQYPETDELELISREFEGSWQAPATTDEVWRRLTAEYGLPLTAGHGFPKPEPCDDKALARELWNAARSLQIAVDTRRHLLKDKALRDRVGRRTISCGLYMITRNVWRYLTPVIEAIVPADVRFTALSTYGARWVAEYLGAADFSPAFLRRTRIYTWCEFDGMMFQQQNHCTGLKACVDLACRFGSGRNAAGLLANHWRNAENEDSISYLAAAAWSGVAPDAFHARHLAALCGTPRIARLAQAFALLDSATDLAIRTLFNSGFCPPFVWTGSDTLDNVSRYTAEAVADYRTKLLQAAASAGSVIPHIRRREGMERGLFLINRIEASLLHCDILANLVKMRGFLLKHPAGKPLGAPGRKPFLRMLDQTRRLVARYTACTASMMPDRGAEGVITLYEQCLDGCLDRLGAAYLRTAPLSERAEGRLVPVPVLDPSKQKA